MSNIKFDVEDMTGFQLQIIDLFTKVGSAAKLTKYRHEIAAMTNTIANILRMKQRLERENSEIKSSIFDAVLYGPTTFAGPSFDTDVTGSFRPSKEMVKTAQDFAEKFSERLSRRGISASFKIGESD